MNRTPVERIKRELVRFGSRIIRRKRNLLSSVRIRFELAAQGKPIADVTRYEKRVYSQNGEDGILEAIFSVVGTTNRYIVELGAGSGRECNSAYLVKRRGWTGLLVDSQGGCLEDGRPIHAEFITADNIESLFDKYAVPAQFDLLSIDIDGNDYWVWEKITRWRPRVVVIEYNASVPVTESRAIEYDPDFRWTGTDYFGASLLALKKLAEKKGYTLVGCDSSGTNAFFVESSLIPGRFEPQSIERMYRPPAYRTGQPHPRDGRRVMIPV